MRGGQAAQVEDGNRQSELLVEKVPEGAEGRGVERASGEKGHARPLQNPEPAAPEVRPGIGARVIDSLEVHARLARDLLHGRGARGRSPPGGAQSARPERAPAGRERLRGHARGDSGPVEGGQRSRHRFIQRVGHETVRRAFLRDRSLWGRLIRLHELAGNRNVSGRRVSIHTVSDGGDQAVVS